VRAFGLARLVTASLALVVGLGLAVGTANVAQANGCGVPFNAGTYSLSIPAHFAVLGGCDPTASYVLVNDVDLAGITVAKRTNFMGTFDGQGFTISNMTVTGSAMFDVSVAGATFTRVNFRNAQIVGGNGPSIVAGSLVGVAFGTTTITDSSFEGRVLGGSVDFAKTGGLVGYNDVGLVVSNVSIDAVVIGGASASAVAGGFLGKSGGPVTITASSFNGSVTGGSGSDAAAGGIVGATGGFSSADVSISNTYAAATVVGGSGFVSPAGAFVGYAFGGILRISSSYVNGSVTGGTGPSDAGGFVGTTEGSVAISQSYMTGTLTGGSVTNAPVGGFIGAARFLTAPASIEVTDSYVRATSLGGSGGASRTGGVIGYRQSSIPLSTSVVNSYGEGSLSSGSGNQAWAFALSSNAAPTISATGSFCVVSCESGGTGVGTTVSAVNLVSAAQSAGWNFSSTWCSSPSYNDGFPVLKGLTFGPNAAWGSCGAVVAPTPSVVPVWSVSVNLDGGTCRDTSGPLSGAFIGYRYLPGAAECSRPGYVFRGWARASDPNKVIDLPLLVDPSDGVRRYFFATGADLVAVWSAAPTPPSAMTPFVAFSNFLCDRCTTLWLIWSGAVERQTATSRVVVTDASGREVCATGVVDIAPWRVCAITGLTPGSTHTYRIVVSDGGVSSAPISTQITLNNRRR